MLEKVEAQTFHKFASSGKTRPCILTCTRSDNTNAEVYVKLSTMCERKGLGLACEAIAAMLARDLDLPVPVPLVVQISRHFATTITTNQEAHTILMENIGPNFGSLRLASGFKTYPQGLSIPSTAFALAAEILAYDTLIANPDRRIGNSNLMFLQSGEFVLIDHELAFTHEQQLFWRPPWDSKGIDQSLLNMHVLIESIRGTPVCFDRLTGAFQAITNKRLMAYRRALPEEWTTDKEAVDRIFRYIVDVRHHADIALQQIREALK